MVPDPHSVGSGARRKRQAPAIHPFDRMHGTDTSGLWPGEVVARGTGYAPTDLTAYYGVAPSILHGTVALWLRECAPPEGIERTVFLDVGAGKGRAMLLASQHPFLRVEGVELNPALAGIARENLRLWENDAQAAALAPLVLREGDATRLPLPAQPTVAFLFHPFELTMLRRFIRLVTASVQEAPRTFSLIYVNAEHAAPLDRHRGLERCWIGRVPMSVDDHLADLAAIAQQKEYGSTGDEVCALYRVTTPAPASR